MSATAAGAAAHEVLGIWGLLIFVGPVAGIRHAYFCGANEADRDDSERREAA